MPIIAPGRCSIAGAPAQVDAVLTAARCRWLAARLVGPWHNRRVSRQYPLDLVGFSTAGIETAIEVPSLALVLDLGRCSRTAINQPLVLVSHGHLDHIGAIVQHAARRAMMKMGESVYVVPASIAADVERMFAAAEALDGGRIPRRVVPLGHGEELELGKKRRVRAFETFHRVPSQGYTIWERRHRLRAEFRELDGPRLGELRRSGQELDAPYEVPVLCFSGDTRVEVLERTPSSSKRRPSCSRLPFSTTASPSRTRARWGTFTSTN